MIKSKQVIFSVSETFINHFIDMTDDELKDVINEANGLTGTNCWWVSYNLRNKIIFFCEDILNTRKSKRQPAHPSHQ